MSFTLDWISESKRYARQQQTNRVADSQSRNMKYFSRFAREKVSNISWHFFDLFYSSFDFRRFQFGSMMLILSWTRHRWLKCLDDVLRKKCVSYMFEAPATIQRILMTRRGFCFPLNSNHSFFNSLQLLLWFLKIREVLFSACESHNMQSLESQQLNSRRKELTIRRRGSSSHNINKVAWICHPKVRVNLVESSRSDVGGWFQFPLNSFY